MQFHLDSFFVDVLVKHHFLVQCGHVEVVKYLLVLILTTKDEDLSVKQRGAVAVSCRGDVALLLTTDPPNHFFFAAKQLQSRSVDYLSLSIVLDQALSVVDLLVQSEEDIGIIEAFV